MYCKYCGSFLDDNSVYCTKCGMLIDENQNNNLDDHSNVGFAILGFFIPLIGLIFFLIYENKQPKRAKSAGKGALIGVITRSVIWLIGVILYIVFVFSVVEIL